MEKLRRVAVRSSVFPKTLFVVGIVFMGTLKHLGTFVVGCVSFPGGAKITLAVRSLFA